MAIERGRTKDKEHFTIVSIYCLESLYSSYTINTDKLITLPIFTMSLVEISPDVLEYKRMFATSYWNSPSSMTTSHI